jgi:hypothetical protein
MNTAKLFPAQCRKARRALERRFGASTMPYAFKRRPLVALVIRCTDTESGSWVEMDFSRRGPARVVAEFDGAA